MRPSYTLGKVPKHRRNRCQKNTPASHPVTLTKHYAEMLQQQKPDNPRTAAAETRRTAATTVAEEKTSSAQQ